MSNDYSKYYKKSKTVSTKDNKKTPLEATSTRDNRDVAEAQKVDKAIFGILLAILGILPLLTRTKVIDFTGPQITNNLSIGSGTVADVFTYYKFIFLIIATSILIILFLYRAYGIGIPIKKSFINIPLAILALFVALSALLAPFKSLALIGMYNRHEGALTYLCYFTLFFIAANLTYTKKMLHNVIYALYPIVIVNTILGLLGFYGVDLIKSSFARAILLPKGITEEMIGAGSQFITTINHGNYVSGISVVLIVIFMMMFILDKNKIRQAANTILAIFSFAMLLSSLSRSGFLTFLLMLPLLALILLVFKERLKNYSKFGTQLGLFAIVFFIMASHNPLVWDESMGTLIKSNPFNNQESSTVLDATAIKKLSLRGFDNLFESKVYAQSENTGQNSEEPFMLPTLPEYGTAPGTGRLYIWEKALELIKDKPITGYGLDTFSYHFPQNDPGKISGLASHTVIVDKPHNVYINMLYGAGMIAFITLLLLFGTALFKGLKQFFGNRFEYSEEKGFIFISIFFGITAYLIQGLFNDSIIGSAPIFWVLFGVYVAIMKEIKLDIKEN